MKRSLILFTVLALALPVIVSAQQGASGVRDYVGLINQSYHPSIVSYFEKLKAEMQRQGATDAARAVDIFLSGGFGSGFIYNDARGNFYVITNNHVVSQAHSLSITFERTDGTKTKIENLRIIATDVETDLAILALPEGVRPLVQRGLTLLTRTIEEGEDVFSAGFPGLGITPLWQFGRGMVSNAVARFPKSLTDETLLGPFIQHTAQIDAGNSGGPLLVAQSNAPSGYAVVGINTLTGVGRQAANYAIPVNKIQPFINNALNPRPETFRAALDERLEKFVEGISGRAAFYSHISEFLSTVCIGENAEYAFEEMLKKANRLVVRDFFKQCEENVVGAMGIAIAWTIQENIHISGNLNAVVKEVTGDGEEYTVVFTINNRDVSSVWIREYGNWRIKSFGTIAAGDPSLINRRETQKKLRLDSEVHLELGYANLFDKAPNAFYASFSYTFIGLNLYTTGSDFIALGVFADIKFSIPAGNIGFMPYIRLGFSFISDQEYKDAQKAEWGSGGFDSQMAFFAQFGLKITTSYVPGLFIGGGFQFNYTPLGDDYAMERALAITVGYMF
ncbi:MAG: serine protease [Treponema sp.]|jgi:serine protease Do|nr:serine protease [Treponema sp.]